VGGWELGDHLRDVSASATGFSWFNGLLMWDKCFAAITMIYRDCFDHCMISMIRSGVS
jgi:hypothetical protein